MQIVTDAAGRYLGVAARVLDFSNGNRPLSYPNKPRRRWLLKRLARADGPAYDDLVREVIAAFPVGQGKRYWARVQAVRAVRDALYDELAVTEADESIWLTSAGWTALEALSARTGAS